MKKRKLKKSFIIILILPIIAIALLVLLLSKNDKEETPTTLNKDYETVTSMMVAGNMLMDSSIITDGILEQDKYSFEYIFEDLPLIKEKVDLKYFNQAALIGGSKLGYSKGTKYNVPSESGDLMIKYGFNLISLASKYSLDKAEQGINNTFDYWNKKENILFNGISKNNAEKERVSVLEKNNIKYALISYTMKTNVPLIKNKENLVNIYDKERVKADIVNAKKTADILIVSIDWRDNENDVITEEQKNVVKYLADLGVNIIIGNNVYIQPITIEKESLVIYSSGNLISGHTDYDKSSSTITTFDIVIKKEKDKTTKIEYNNIKSYLVFLNKKSGANYKLISYSNLNDQILPNYREYYDKYKNIITKELGEVVINEVGD